MNYIRAISVSVLLVFLAGCLSQSESVTAPADSSQTANTQNSPPSISGAPANAVKTGDNYSFTPSASDPDGDSLTFSVENLPRWASFDSRNGRITGQPLLGDEGVYSGIAVTVSDGSASSSMSAFSIEVTQAALGAMTLSWTPPTENEDGSALTDLGGYVIYYGESPGSYPNRIRITNPSISTYVVENLLPRTYYIVATALNAAGVESRYSGMASKTVVAN